MPVVVVVVVVHDVATVHPIQSIQIVHAIHAIQIKNIIIIVVVIVIRIEIDIIGIIWIRIVHRGGFGEAPLDMDDPPVQDLPVHQPDVPFRVLSVVVEYDGRPQKHRRALLRRQEDSLHEVDAPEELPDLLDRVGRVDVLHVQRLYRPEELGRDGPGERELGREGPVRLQKCGGAAWKWGGVECLDAQKRGLVVGEACPAVALRGAVGVHVQLEPEHALVADPLDLLDDLLLVERRGDVPDVNRVLGVRLGHLAAHKLERCGVLEAGDALRVVDGTLDGLGVGEIHEPVPLWLTCLTVSDDFGAYDSPVLGEFELEVVLLNV